MEDNEQNRAAFYQAKGLEVYSQVLGMVPGQGTYQGNTVNKKHRLVMDARNRDPDFSLGEFIDVPALHDRAINESYRAATARTAQPVNCEVFKFSSHGVTPFGSERLRKAISKENGSS